MFHRSIEVSGCRVRTALHVFPLQWPQCGKATARATMKWNCMRRDQVPYVRISWAASTETSSCGSCEVFRHFCLAFFFQIDILAFMGQAAWWDIYCTHENFVRRPATNCFRSQRTEASRMCYVTAPLVGWLWSVHRTQRRQRAPDNLLTSIGPLLAEWRQNAAWQQSGHEVHHV